MRRRPLDVAAAVAMAAECLPTATTSASWSTCYAAATVLSVVPARTAGPSRRLATSGTALPTVDWRALGGARVVGP